MPTVYTLKKFYEETKALLEKYKAVTDTGELKVRFIYGDADEYHFNGTECSINYDGDGADDLYSWGITPKEALKRLETQLINSKMKIRPDQLTF